MPLMPASRAFAALTQLPSVPITQVGIAVAVGVLLDTLLVRTVLIPASPLAAGERAGWPAQDPAGLFRDTTASSGQAGDIRIYRHIRRSATS
jgi:uncharacterized membrane protein YdfJ with MMPL/SSD domain